MYEQSALSDRKREAQPSVLYSVSHKKGYPLKPALMAHACMHGRESQNRQKSLLAWCIIYYNSRVFFDCVRPVLFKQFE